VPFPAPHQPPTQATPARYLSKPERLPDWAPASPWAFKKLQLVWAAIPFAYKAKLPSEEMPKSHQDDSLRFVGQPKK
jgi:hypothetical protein